MANNNPPYVHPQPGISSIPGYTYKNGPQGAGYYLNPSKAPLKKLPPLNPKLYPTLTYGKGTMVYDKGGNPIHRVDIAGIQKHLLTVGYKITPTGKLDAITKSALADYLRPNQQHPIGAALAQVLRGTTLTGHRNPSKWNQRFGTNRKTQKVERPLTGPGGQLNRFGNDPPAGGGGGKPQAPAGPAFPHPLPIAPGEATAGIDYLPDSYAEQQAALQFDPSIHQAQIAADRLPKRTAQDLHDIETWYGNAMDSQKTAATRDAAIGQGTRQSVEDATKAIIASLGGSANAGTGVVGAAGADSVGTLGAISQSQDQYNQDVAPIMALEKAGAMQNEQNRGNNDLTDINNQLIDLHGQRGAAKSTALQHLREYNQGLRDSAFARAMQIKQYNDGLQQQDFNNHQSVRAADISSLLAGAKLASVAGKPAKGSFAGMNVTDRAAIRNTMVEGVLTQLKSTHSVPQAVSYLGTVIRSQGWSFANPSVKQFAFNVLQLAGIKPDAKWFQ